MLVAGGLDTVQLFGILDELAGNAGLEAAEFFERVGFTGPDGGLGDHGFGGVVIGGIGISGVGDADVEDVVLDGENAVEAGVAVDDFLDELAFGFIGGFVVGIEGSTDAPVGFEFMLLEDHAIAGKPMLEGVEGATRAALEWSFGIRCGRRFAGTVFTGPVEIDAGCVAGMVVVGFLGVSGFLGFLGFLDCLADFGFHDGCLSAMTVADAEVGFGVGWLEVVEGIGNNYFLVVN